MPDWKVLPYVDDTMLKCLSDSRRKRVLQISKYINENEVELTDELIYLLLTEISEIYRQKGWKESKVFKIFPPNKALQALLNKLPDSKIKEVVSKRLDNSIKLLDVYREVLAEKRTDKSTEEAIRQELMNRLI